MNTTSQSLFSGGFVVFLIGFFTFVTTVFWMVVAWRAMRAHERIASTLDETLPR